MIIPIRNASLPHPSQQVAANPATQSIRFGREEGEKQSEPTAPKTLKEGFLAFVIELLKKVWDYFNNSIKPWIDERLKSATAPEKEEPAESQPEAEAQPDSAESPGNPAETEDTLPKQSDGDNASSTKDSEPSQN